MYLNGYETLTKHVHFSLEAADEKLASIFTGAQITVDNFKVTDSVTRAASRGLHGAGYTDVMVRKGDGLTLEVLSKGEMLGTVNVVTSADDLVDESLIDLEKADHPYYDDVAISDHYTLDDFRQDSERKLDWADIEDMEHDVKAIIMYDPEQVSKYIDGVRLEDFSYTDERGQTTSSMHAYASDFRDPDSTKIEKMSDFTNGMLDLCQSFVTTQWAADFPGDDISKISVMKGADDTKEILFMRDGKQVGSANFVLVPNSTYADMWLPGDRQVGDLEFGNPTWADMQEIESKTREYVMSKSYAGKRGLSQEDFKFDFNDINKYASFEFNSPDFEAPLFHDVTVEDQQDMRMSNFSETVLSYAECLANASFDGNEITVKKGNGEGLPIEVHRDEEVLGTVYLEPCIRCVYEGEYLPTGDNVSNMQFYSWKEFEQLEQIAKAQEAALDRAQDEDDLMDFANAVANLSGPEGPTR